MGVKIVILTLLDPLMKILFVQMMFDAERLLLDHGPKRWLENKNGGAMTSLINHVLWWNCEMKLYIKEIWWTALVTCLNHWLSLHLSFLGDKVHYKWSVPDLYNYCSDKRWFLPEHQIQPSLVWVPLQCSLVPHNKRRGIWPVTACCCDHHQSSEDKRTCWFSLLI